MATYLIETCCLGSYSSHFCRNWGTFILLTWMPTYYNQVFKFNLTESGLFCVLPWLTMAFSANIGGWIADTLVSRGLSATMVRKIMQSIRFLGPASFLTQLSHVRSPEMAVLCICMAFSQGADAFSQSGLYSNHQDIGPHYAGVLLGLSNTAGVLAGVFGTAAMGYILQHGLGMMCLKCPWLFILLELWSGTFSVVGRKFLIDFVVIVIIIELKSYWRHRHLKTTKEIWTKLID